MKLTNNINNELRKKQFTIGIRGSLYLGFGILTLIILIAISIVITRTTSANYHASQLTEYELSLNFQSHDLMQMISGTLNSTQSYLIDPNPKFKTVFDQYWNNINKIIPEIDRFSNNFVSSEIIEWNQVKNTLDQLKQEQAKIFDESIDNVNKKNEITNIQNIVNQLYDILDGPINNQGQRLGGMFDKQYNNLQEHSKVIMSDLHNIILAEYIMMTTIIILSILIASWTAKKILVPLSNAISIAKKIASGERGIVIKSKTNDETGQLLRALDVMQHSIMKNEQKLTLNEVKTRELFEDVVKTANIFSQHSSEVAAGNLTKRITFECKNEMKQLGKDLNTMTDSLADITKKIMDACHNMVSTIEEVKHSVDVQSSGSTEQASSINEITVSLEEIEKSSSQTIEKAKALGEVADKTRAKGEEGLTAVEESINGMNAVRDKVQAIAQTILELSNQTQQIGEITSVVTTLSQQSKMLALNASIEAAKAGEAGKGFAVVASEVKSLAEQSEQSTIQVQKILEDIRRATEKAVMATEEGTKGVDHGTSLVEKTGNIINSLRNVIHEATIASQQIETAIRQEGIGIEQITAGMNEINQVTSTFVESVKQTNEAITNLAVTAKNLKEYVDIYQL